MDQPPKDTPSPLQARKRAAILSGARKVFLHDGFGGSSMDDIALAAGVGKQTVYRHFGAKEALFEGLIEEMCGGVFAAPTLDAHDLRGALCEVGRGFVKIVTDPANLALFRIVVAEADRFPALARRFHSAGVATATAFVADLIVQEAAIGRSRAQDLAATFLEMVKGPAFLRLLLGAPKASWNNSFDRQVDRAVDYTIDHIALIGRSEDKRIR